MAATGAAAAPVADAAKVVLLGSREGYVCAHAKRDRAGSAAATMTRRAAAG